MVAILSLTAFLILIPLLLGTGFCILTKQKACDNGLRMISGLLILMTVFEGVGLFAIKLNLSLYQLAMIFMTIICILVLGDLYIIKKELSDLTQRVRRSISYGTDKLIFTAIVILVLICLFIYIPDNAGDTISETVRTTIFTNTLYQFNPLTGQVMENGMYPVYQICTIPVFDACLITLTGTDTATFLNIVFPAFTILSSLLVIWLWARLTEKPRIFMIVYTLLLLFSLNKSDTFAYELMHKGHQGNVFALAVILPFTCYLIYARRKLYSARTIISYTIMILATFAMNINITGFKNMILVTNMYTRTICVVVMLITAIYLLHTERFGKKSNLLWFAALFLLVLMTGFYYPVAAFVLADVLERLESGKKRNIILVVFICFIALTGSVFLYTEGDAGILKDTEQTDEIDTVINIIEDYKSENNLETVTVVAPRVIMNQLRKRDATILLPYGRDYWDADVNLEIGDIYNDEAYSLYAGMVEMENTITQNTTADETTDQLMLRVAGKARDLDCEILVTTGTLPEIASWDILAKTDGYSVYIVVK